MSTEISFSDSFLWDSEALDYGTGIKRPADYFSMQSMMQVYLPPERAEREGRLFDAQEAARAAQQEKVKALWAATAAALVVRFLSSSFPVHEQWMTAIKIGDEILGETAKASRFFFLQMEGVGVETYLDPQKGKASILLIEAPTCLPLVCGYPDPASRPLAIGSGFFGTTEMFAAVHSKLEAALHRTDTQTLVRRMIEARVPSQG